jgi:hypothetical protein
MGNILSTKNIVERLDEIAAEYILTSEYNTLRQLNDNKYCNKITIITKDILQQFHNMDIEYLVKRVDKGLPFISGNFFTYNSNKPQEQEETKYKNVTLNEKVSYINKIENPDKESMCLSISRFYVKIGHIFAVILKTINPVYVIDGVSYSFTTPKNNIPQGAVLKLRETGFCANRIEALRYGSKYLDSKNEEYIQPNFCSINEGKDNITDEPGIPELRMLYYDTINEDGEPAMSDKNERIYLENLKTFYTIFTGDENMPQEINRFSNIKLKQYGSLSKCMDGQYKKLISKNITNNNKTNNSDNIEYIKLDEVENELFHDYALNLREMIGITTSKQQNLIYILNEIFINKGDKIIIDPLLTMDKLDKLIVKTRNQILELFLRCEEYFENGVKIYQAIVNKRILDNTLDELNGLPIPQYEYDNIQEPVILEDEPLFQPQQYEEYTPQEEPEVENITYEEPIPPEELEEPTETTEDTTLQQTSMENQPPEITYSELIPPQKEEVQPTEPEPVVPTQQVQPTEPEPVVPAQEGQPTEPIVPTQQVQPTEPEPVIPAQQVQPTEPEPVIPAQEIQPTEPEPLIPTQEGQPSQTEPVIPAQEIQPTEPEPVIPAQEGQPSQTEPVIPAEEIKQPEPVVTKQEVPVKLQEAITESPQPPNITKPKVTEPSQPQPVNKLIQIPQTNSQTTPQSKIIPPPVAV